MTTLEQVRKAYEDLSEDDRKAFHQSIADRVHESIGEQEHDDGDKDSQSAADREHEALGAEHADGEGDVDELHETDPEDAKDSETVEEAEEKKDERKDNDIDARLDRLEAMVLKLVEGEASEHAEKKAAEAVETAAEEKAKELYGISGTFVDTSGRDTPYGTVAEQARAILRKIR